MFKLGDTVKFKSTSFPTNNCLYYVIKINGDGTVFIDNRIGSTHIADIIELELVSSNPNLPKSIIRECCIKDEYTVWTFTHKNQGASPITFRSKDGVNFEVEWCAGWAQSSKTSLELYRNDPNWNYTVMYDNDTPKVETVNIPVSDIPCNCPWSEVWTKGCTKGHK